jgi:hypothetical protein
MSDRLHEICAWCWRAGQLTVLSEGSDPMAVLLAIEDHEVSHGICEWHRDEAKAQVATWKNSLVGGAK